MPVSEAVCPAGISSFFEICTTDSAGSPLTDPAQIGARGGGFGIARGIRARVAVRRASKTRIEIRINSKPAPEARTTKWALEKLLRKAGKTLGVRADLTVSVPVGAGYGTSAAGTVASSLALADAAQLPITLNELGRLTHVAEVVNGTGLGTASALLVGGFVLVIQPGAPGIGRVDRLLFPKDHSILCVYLGSIPTQDTLRQVNIASKVNPAARRVMESIRRKPDLSTFLTEARNFSKEVGFQTPEITRIMETAISAGAVGAAQNMIGKAVHTVAETSRISRIAKVLRRTTASAFVFSSHLADTGVRLVEERNPKH